MITRLVAFDLDGTLIDEDSAQLWLSFLQEQNWPGADLARHYCDEVMDNYDSGQMDMGKYMDAWLAPLAGLAVQQAKAMAEQFTQKHILPKVFPSGYSAVGDHKQRGDILLIISASPSLVVQPIARLFGVHNVIAIEAVTKNGFYTGQAIEPFSFGPGKLTCLKTWQQNKGIEHMPLWDMYSDSINDLPLLRHAQNGHVINANLDLQTAAAQYNWTRYQWHVKTESAE